VNGQQQEKLAMRNLFTGKCEYVLLLLVLSGLAPTAAYSQSLLRDLFRASNQGPLPEPTTTNVPGKTVRIKVGEVEAATWAGRPQWLLDGPVKFGPLHLSGKGNNAEWNVPDVHCLVVENLTQLDDRYSEYDRKDNVAEWETVNYPIVLEFVLPNDQKLYGQTLTADLQLNVKYMGLERIPYEPPRLTEKHQSMTMPVSFKVATAEEAKHYSGVSDSGFIRNLKFYGALLGCFLFLLLIGRLFFGRRR